MFSVRVFIDGIYSVLTGTNYKALQENQAPRTVQNVASKIVVKQESDHNQPRAKSFALDKVPIKTILWKTGAGKFYEWYVILEGLANAFRTFFMQTPQIRSEPEFTAYIDSICQRDPKELFLNKLSRQVHIQYKLGKLPAANYNEQLETLEPFIDTLLRQESSHAILHDLKEWLINLEVSDDEEVIDAKACDLFKDLLLVYDKQHFTESFEKLKKEIKQIGNLIFNIDYKDPDPKQRTLAILYRLRDALRQPAYRLACTAEHDPLVSFLHNLSIASLTNSEVVNCYKGIGNAILDSEIADYDPKTTTLGELVEKLRNVAIKAGIPKDDEQPQKPLVESIGFILSQITASIPVEQAVANGWKLYKAKTTPAIKDYRGFYENNPCKLYDETRGHVKNCVVITSSPAAGNDVAPEFCALLQSIENCNVMGINAPFQFVAYSNLQDKKGGKEEQQTKALMRLEGFYELSIKCITVHQGSYKNKNKDKPFTKAQKDIKLQELVADDNFMLTHPGRGNGYYFAPKDKERWKIVSSRIVNIAYNYIVRGKQEATDEEKYIAFSELVNLGIIRHHENVVAKQLPNKSTMISIRSCGPACDRSVKINMAMMSALPRKAASEREVAAIGAGRSISAKGRVMTEERAVAEFGSLYKVMTCDTLRNCLDDIDKIDDKSKIAEQDKPKRRTCNV